MQFCISVLCIIDAAAAGIGMSLDAFRQLRDDVIGRSATGRQYLTLLDRHGPELVEVLGADDQMRDRAARALDGLHRAIEPGGGKGKLSQHVVAELDDLAHSLEARPGISRPLSDALRQVRADLPAFRGRSVSEGLAELDKRGPREP